MAKAPKVKTTRRIIGKAHRTIFPDTLLRPPALNYLSYVLYQDIINTDRNAENPKI
jgi:hypothetical protein